MKLTSQDKEQEANQQTIPHIQDPRREASEAQFADPVQQRVGEHIEGTCPSRTESPPLPVVILTAEQEVD